MCQYTKQQSSKLQHVSHVHAHQHTLDSLGDTVTSHDIAEMEKTACKHQSLCQGTFVMTKG